MKTTEIFPNDENGDVLRRMQDHGDDLSVARDIDFTVVFPSDDDAQAFAERFRSRGLTVTVKETGCKPDCPWDAVVTIEMIPTHGGITAFEAELESVARALGGRNDGWGCFQQ